MLSMDQCCCVGYLGHFKVISMGLSCAIGDFHSPHSLFNEKRFSRLFALPSYICLNVVCHGIADSGSPEHTTDGGVRAR